MPDKRSGLNGLFDINLDKSIMTSDTRVTDDVKSISEPHQSGHEPSSSQYVSNTRSRAQNSSRNISAVQITENVNREESNTSPDKTVPRGCALGQRTSIRISKRPKRDPSPPATQAQPTAKKGVPKQNLQRDQLKTRRAWELWSVEDKNAFFEALCEYGKDFESIQSYIAQRSRKKGVPPNMIKNKDQVRHFYYRTWHKISKYLDIGDDVKKRTQELYGLINYAELRKKIGSCLSDKNRLQLNELVFSGVTFIKYRGKKLRIKTPVCRALKRLNNVEESKEPEVQKMPKEVVIEFRPHNNGAWSHVHNLAQNPRVRTKLSLQRRLKTVIEYLQKRWKPYRLRQKEQIMANAGNSDLSTLAEPVSLLRVRPKQDAVISLLEISTMDAASSIDVCLKNYQKNVVSENLTDKEPVRKGKSLGKVKNKNETKMLANKEEIKINAEKTVKLEKSNDDLINPQTNSASSLSTLSSNNKKSEHCENPVFEAQRSLTLLKGMLNSMKPKSSEAENCDKNINCISQTQVDESGDVVDEISRREDSEIPDGKGDIVDTPNCKSIEEIYLSTQQDAENMTLGQLLGLATGEKNDDKHEGCEKTIETNSPDFIVKCNGTVNMSTSTEKTDVDCQTEKVLTDERIHIIRKGWTEETVGTLTIGELYLMMGSPQKIILEYSWDHPEISETCNMNGDIAEKSLSENVEELQNLSIVLQKLLQVASMTFTDFKTKQQEPLSPTCRSSVRSATTPPTGKVNVSRSSTRNPNVRSGIRGNHPIGGIKGSTPKSIDSNIESPNICQNATKADGEKASNPNQVPTSSSDNLHQDKHVFVVPVGTAPRTVKQPVIASPDAIREQLDRFLPAQRRGGSRMRSRKPLVVQRPLLPRGGIGSLEGPRPMTVVHLVPSSSQITPLTAVIPSTTNRNVGTNKVVLPQTKKVVKILPPGSPVDMQSIPVPLLKTVGNSSSGVVLPTNNISTDQVVVSTSTVASTLETSPSDVTASHHHVTSSLLPILSSENPVVSHEVKSETLSGSTVNKSSVVSTSTSVSIEGVPLQVLSSTAKNPSLSNICITTTCSSSPPQISIPENTSSSSISPPNISSILEISLSEGEYANLPTETIPGPGSEHLLGFNENSDSSLSAAFDLPSSLSSNKMQRNVSSVPTCIPTCLSSDPVVAVRQTTPPHSPPPSSHFRICSPVPENHWLNGESGDFSLSSLLNTLESPCKPAPVIPSMNMTTDSSNLDPIARLAPDVDTQLQCLMNESSIDYVAKFADLAAQIASSSSTETKST